MSVSRRTKVALGCIAALAGLNGAYAGWRWLENNRLINQITGSYVSPELEEALQSIKGVVAAFERDVRDDVKWDWTRERVPSVLVNLLILNTIHERAVAMQVPPTAGLKAGLLPGDEEVGREAARYMRFASAAYGMLMLKGANVMSWDSGWPPIHKFNLQELSAWCITKHCGIPEEDLVKVDMENKKLHLPGYLIAVDHATRSVVLSVRGTFSMQDTVTDLVCDSAEFMGGSCHRGLRQSAETLLSETKDDLLEHLKRHKGYRLVLSGHSLGGGVSILLTMMIMKRKREMGLAGTDVLCYAFAPPPVFAPLEKLPAETRRAIRAFVFGNDMVSRLSLSSAYGVFRDLKEVDAVEAGLSLRCRYLAGERRPHLSVDDDGRGVVAMRVAYRYSTILRRTRSRGGNRAKATGNGDGADSCDAVEHPVEAFVQNKLANDFTETGTAAIQRYLKRRATQGAASRSGYAHSGLEYRGSRGRSSAGSGSGGRDKYQKLLIPGTIYHMKKRGPEPQPGSGGAAASNAPMVLGGTPAEERHDTEYWMEREPPEEFARILMVDTAIVDHLPMAYEDALHALYGDGLPGLDDEGY